MQVLIDSKDTDNSYLIPGKTNIYTANMQSIDLYQLSQSLLKNLQTSIKSEIEKNHKPDSSEENSVLDLTKGQTEKYYKEIGIDNISWPWFDYEYTQEWDYFTLNTRVDYKINDKSTSDRIFSEVERNNGKFNLIRLKIDDKIVFEVENKEAVSEVPVQDIMLFPTWTPEPVIETTPIPTPVLEDSIVPEYTTSDTVPDSVLKLFNPPEETALQMTAEPTAEPTVEPTAEPTVKPTTEPTKEPASEPISESTELSSSYEKGEKDVKEEVKGQFKVRSNGNVNVRSGPSSDTLKVGTAQANHKYDVLAEDQNWYQIILEDGTVGWISGKMGTVLGEIKNLQNSEKNNANDTKDKYDMAYVIRGKEYYQYWVINSNSKTIKYFVTNDYGVSAGHYEGDLINGAAVYYKGYGTAEPIEYICFKWKSSDSKLIIQDYYGSEYEASKTDVDNALKYLNNPKYHDIED